MWLVRLVFIDMGLWTGGTRIYDKWTCAYETDDLMEYRLFLNVHAHQLCCSDQRGRLGFVTPAFDGGQ